MPSEIAPKLGTFSDHTESAIPASSRPTGKAWKRHSSGTTAPSRTRSFDCVARMPSVSHVRTISRPGVSTGIPLKNTICGPSAESSSFAHVVKCVATSDSVKKILRPSSR